MDTSNINQSNEKKGGMPPTPATQQSVKKESQVSDAPGPQYEEVSIKPENLVDLAIQQNEDEIKELEDAQTREAELKIERKNQLKIDNYKLKQAKLSKEQRLYSELDKKKRQFGSKAYIEFTAELKDANGNVIDRITIDGSTGQPDAAQSTEKLFSQFGILNTQVSKFKSQKLNLENKDVIHLMKIQKR